MALPAHHPHFQSMERDREGEWSSGLRSVRSDVAVKLGIELALHGNVRREYT